MEKKYAELSKQNELLKKQSDSLQLTNINWQKNYQVLQNHNLELQNKINDFNFKLFEKDQQVSKLYDSLINIKEKYQSTEIKRQELEHKIDKLRKFLE